MAHIRRRTIAVIGENIKHDSRACRTITLVHKLFVVTALAIAKALLDGTFDIILWDIV